MLRSEWKEAPRHPKNKTTGGRPPLDTTVGNAHITSLVLFIKKNHNYTLLHRIIQGLSSRIIKYIKIICVSEGSVRTPTLSPLSPARLKPILPITFEHLHRLRKNN